MNARTTTARPTSTPVSVVVETRAVSLIVLTTTLSISTFALLFMGALVTSHGAGLAVPDWPTTFGENMFTYPPTKWIGGIFFEHVHRLVASGIGVLTTLIALWVSLYESRASVRILTYISLIAVIAQGLLGGLTVMYQLPVIVSTMHAVLGQSFFLLTLLLTTIAWSDFEKKGQLFSFVDTNEQRSISRSCFSLIALLYGQLFVGALMRHSESGLAIPDFPFMGGSLLPLFTPTAIEKINTMRLAIGLGDVTQPQVLVHFAHRLLGLCLVLAFSIFLARLIRMRKSIPALWIVGGKLLAFLITIQFTLGAFAIWTHRAPLLTSAHVVGGAALLGGTALLLFQVLPLHRYFGFER